MSYEELFIWKDRSYRCWVIYLDSFKPVIKKYGTHDAFMFNDGEHFEELRNAVMLEF